MRLYVYYLSKDNEVKKEIQSNVRENKRQYIIPAMGKSILGGLSEWRLSKGCCEKVQVDNSICKKPFIVSSREDLCNITNLCGLLAAVSESCNVLNSRIKEQDEQ